MKKIITIALVIAFLFGSFTVSTFAASSSGGYVKVKKATYQKYKKAYSQNKELKKQIKELKAELENKDGLNSWTWMCIKSLGLSYKEKEWTIPNEFPSTFMINGTSYTVRR